MTLEKKSVFHVHPPTDESDGSLLSSASDSTMKKIEAARDSSDSSSDS